MHFMHIFTKEHIINVYYICINKTRNNGVYTVFCSEYKFIICIWIEINKG